MTRLRVRSRRIAMAVLVAAVALAACGLIAAAYVGEVERARDLRLADLGTIADLKVRQVTDWRRERFLDAYWLTRSAPFRDAVTRVLEPSRPASGTYARARTRIAEQLTLYTELEAYRNAFLVDARGRVIAAANGEHVDHGSDIKDIAALAVALRRPVIGDPYQGSTGDAHYRVAARARPGERGRRRGRPPGRPEADALLGHPLEPAHG